MDAANGLQPERVREGRVVSMAIVVSHCAVARSVGQMAVVGRVEVVHMAV